MKRVLLAIAMTAGLMFGAPAVSNACEITSQCQMGNHADCPYALGSSEDFNCACECHDAMFEVEVIELGLR
jgi:hypothetical protein